MKTIISNKSGEALEIAKSIFYSIQVLGIGLFIPFMFFFGISYNVPKEVQHESEVQSSKPAQLIWENTTVNYAKFLSDQNS
ncbi:MAG TPA: hypothetical protein VN722_10765 [Hanamia sp.]|jgi:hypothetical protein|nr:hypothetical protein [Hanamia sp.]